MFSTRFSIRSRSRNLLVAAFATLLMLLSAGRAAAQRVDTNPLNRDPLVRQAFAHFYNLDYNGALALFQKVEAKHPDDPIATDYVLYVTAFHELFRLDLLDTTFYATNGFLTGKHTVEDNPAVRAQVESLTAKAIEQADVDLKRNPKDVNALFARGWAKSLEAVYLAMADRKFLTSYHWASGANSDEEAVLKVDPNYVDAKMITGVYQYVVGALPWTFKILFGIVGIHGSKTKGLALLEDSAAHGVITSVESRTVLALFFRRETQYQKAIAVNRTLVAEYPHNFLFNLERANLSKDAGQGMIAVHLYEQVIADAEKPGYFPSSRVELADFGLGASLRGQKLYAQAVKAFQAGAYRPATSLELRRRCLLAAGESYDLIGQHSNARKMYQEVLNAGANTVQGDRAQHYMNHPYRAK